MLRYSPVNQPLPNLPWNRKEGEKRKWNFLQCLALFPSEWGCQINSQPELWLNNLIGKEQTGYA